MNLLLHRHFARRETGSDASGFGAMLPDLVRLVDRRWRPRAGSEVRSAPSTPIACALHEGIAHHFEADSWFHETRVFHEGEKRTGAALRLASPDARRIGLFGHVTWEMCLDGAWLRASGDVTAALAELAVDVTRFAGDSNDALRAATATPTVPPGALAERLEVLWARLPDLAAGYAVGAGVARRLDGIRRSLGLPPADDELLERWARALETCITEAVSALPALEAERSDALARAHASAPG